MEQAHCTYTFSVIIPTYLRIKYVKEVLRLLKEQSVKALEVIVVDASPAKVRTDDLVTVGLETLVYVPVDFQGNISRQRNIAIMKAKGDILLFLDDDVVFESDLIESYLFAYKETAADGICGVILDNGMKRDLQYMKKKRPVLYNPGGVNLRYADFVADTHVISTANFACKRDAILSVGGFDEEIFGTIEDVELGIRLVKAGYKIVHHNKPVLNHLAIKSSGSRSPSLGGIWNHANFFYFQMKHYYINRYLELLIKSVFDFIRPSRAWFAPKGIYDVLRTVFPAYRDAKNRILKGPRYIQSYET